MKLQRFPTLAGRIVVCAVVALVVFAASAAHAAAPSFPTQVGYAAAAPFSPNLVGIIGKVASPKAACIEGRRVKAFAHFPDGTKRQFDVDLSSGHGYWAVAAPVPLLIGSDRVILRVTKQNIGTRRAPVYCLPDTFSFS